MAIRLNKGDVFLERYRVGGILGAGGAGVVYDAQDMEANRRVAIKLLHLVDNQSTSRFLREARTLSQVSHPVLVRAFDHGEHDGVYYLVLEHVEGDTLQDVLEGGPLSPERAVSVLTALLHGLDAAHTEGIIHRDIKPANILLTRGAASYPVKLLDFGLAKAISKPSPDEEAPTQLTQAGMVVGTLRYISPEQGRGQEMTHASDLFSVGLVSYEMLVGSHPLQHLPTEYAVAVELANGSALRLPETVEVSGQVRAVINKLLQPEVNARYISAAEALGDLERGDATVAMTLDAVRAAIEHVDHDSPTVAIDDLEALDFGPRTEVPEPRRQSYVSLVPGSESAEFGSSKSAESAKAPEPVTPEPPSDEPEPSGSQGFALTPKVAAVVLIVFVLIGAAIAALLATSVS